MTTDPPRPSGAFTDALDQIAGHGAARQDEAASSMAEQLRSRFHQRVLDAIVLQEIGALTTEPELANVEVLAITVRRIRLAMMARAARADA